MRITYAIIAATLGLALSSSYITGVLAASAKFHSTPSCSVSSSFILTCTGGDVSGLGNADAAKLSADFQGSYQCAAQQGQQVQGDPSPISNRNGRTFLGTETINPVGEVQQTIQCTASLVGAQYSNVLVHFTLGGAEIAGSPLPVPGGPFHFP